MMIARGIEKAFMVTDSIPWPSGDCYVYGTTTYVRTVGPTDHLGHDHVDLAGLYS